MSTEAARPAVSFFREPTDRKSPRRIKASTALRLYHEVLRLDHLHYGLWDGENPTLENLRTAQDRYLERLLAEIPAGVRTVLDVGCGVGTTSRVLRDRGYEVEGLSPDPIQCGHFEERVGRPIHLGRFQEFVSAHPFDLVLMSESAQYIWIDELFDAVRRNVDAGWLLVGDYFVVGPEPVRHDRSGHRLDEFLARAHASGFELELQEDITERVLPTLDLARSWYDELMMPTLAIVRDAVEARRPWLIRLGDWWFGRRFRRELEKLARQISSEEFRRNKCYLLMRFRIPERARTGSGGD